MCPSCGKLVGLDRVCPYCGKDTGSVRARVSVLARSGRGGVAVTTGLVIANLLVYLLVVLVGGQQPAEGGMEILRPDHATLLRLGLQVPMLVEAGEWWRIVMPIFLHLGLLHLLMNTIVLWLNGRHLEQDIGASAFFFMYIAAGVLGFVASQFAGIGGGGASGAVAGVLGCTIVKRRISDGHFRDPVTMQAIQLVVLNAIFGLVISKVNNVAHLGGFLTGAALGAAFALWQGRAWAHKLWLGGAVVAAGVVVAAVVAMLRYEMPGRLREPAAFEQNVKYALGCINDAGMTLEDGRDVRTEVYESTLRCLRDTKETEPEFDAIVEAFRGGIRAAYDARMGGSFSGEQAGNDEARAAVVRLRRWLGANSAP